MMRIALFALTATLLGGVTQQACAASADANRMTALQRLETDTVRAEDLSAIKKLQRAYGYFADRGLWNELANLFADDAIANYPSGGFDGKASIRAMFVENLGQGKQGLAEGRLYNHTILQPVVDLAADGATATGRWRVLGMLGRFGGSATWADSLYRFDYVKRAGVWRIKSLIAYAGSGGGYADGWVIPKPRPPGTVDTSPVRFNLAHPADRPWIDPCEQDVSACLVPFPYPNRGSTAPPAQVSAVLDATRGSAGLMQRVQRLDDEQALLNLQRRYGYYLDRGMWTEAANLFAPDGRREEGQAGIYIGRERIRRSLAMTGPEGLRRGQLNDHLQLEPIIDVAPDGRTARGRIFELAFTGGGGEPGRIVQNVAENEYVRRGGVWMIQSLHVYTILATDYDQGWAKSALPAPGTSAVLPPDRPPTVTYEAYPKVFTPPLHFDAAQVGNPVAGLIAAHTAQPGSRALVAVQLQVQRVLDSNEIDNLQSAYGYYAEKSRWSDIAELFAADGVLIIDNVPVTGRDNILAALQASGPQGPVQGALDSQLQLQPVIDVAADGRTARMRSRLLQLARDAQGRPLWGGGIYESELVKEQGIWKYRRLQLTPTYQVLYKSGWASPDAGAQPVPVRLAPAMASGNKGVAAQPQRAVAITIDDLPRGDDTRQHRDLATVRAMTEKLLAPLRRQRIPFAGFVNAGRSVDFGPDGLREILNLWLDAGAELGNHTYSHPNINVTGLAPYIADIEKGEPALREVLAPRGKTLRYFRHPFLFTGSTPEMKAGLQQYLDQHGYTVAPVTLDDADYMFARMYMNPATRQRARREYVPYMESVVAFFESRSVEVAGHELPQILLIHASQLNADAMPELLAMFRRRGYRFVTLDEALADPAYRLPENYVGSNGFSWLHRWSKTRGMQPRGEPEPPQWVAAGFEASQ